jgi:deoxyribodipyrimidine photo-lyase
MANYDRTPDFPSVKGPNYLSVHLRHGNRGAETWLSELIWRDFYFSVPHHFPHVRVPGDHRAAVKSASVREVNA